MYSKAKKAIDSLNKHLNDINSISNVQEGNTWKASLKDTLNLYTGDNSSISQRLDKLYFTRKEYSTVKGFLDVFTEHVYDESQKQNFMDLIATAIKHIESNGVYKNPNNKNLLYSFSNAEIISGIVFVILLVFGIGNYFGRIEKDKESLRTDERLKKIENENVSLRETNDSLRQIVKNLNIKLESIKK